MKTFGQALRDPEADRWNVGLTVCQTLDELKTNQPGHFSIVITLEYRDGSREYFASPRLEMTQTQAEQFRQAVEDGKLDKMSHTWEQFIPKQPVQA